MSPLGWLGWVNITQTENGAHSKLMAELCEQSAFWGGWVVGGCGLASRPEQSAQEREYEAYSIYANMVFILISSMRQK